jgi:hypothetical protein
MPFERLARMATPLSADLCRATAKASSQPRQIFVLFWTRNRCCLEPNWKVFQKGNHKMRIKTTALLALSATAVLAIQPAMAQRAPKPPAAITVTNARAAAVTQFEIATMGEQPKLVGRLTKPLAPGKNIQLTLKGASGCSYFVIARFDDGSETEAEGVDICADKTVRLTD